MAEKAGVHIKAQESKQKCSNSCNLKSGYNSSGSPADRVLQLQRTAGNQAIQKLIKSRALQAKLRIGQPNDIYEQEANRVAEQVMRMPDPILQRRCAKCDENEKKALQAKELPGQMPATQDQDVPPIVHEVLCSTGQPLNIETRKFMESRFGYDFSNVQVHTDAKAAESARAVDALAYTVGQNVVFGAGHYAPGTVIGRQLLAHELVHVVQQNVPSSMMNYLQRHEMKTFRVGDPSIYFEGKFISRLLNLKTELMKMQNKDRWALILAIHGSENRVCDVAQPKDPDRQCYDSKRIKSIFDDDRAFVDWRNKYGPSWISLHGCRVGLELESTLINAIGNPNTLQQSAMGLGSGCRPDDIQTPVNKVHTIEQFKRLSNSEKERFKDKLRDLNRKWGYAGTPPVPEEEILDYYFDKKPKGWWIVTKVSVNRQKTEIPFYNRRENSEFRRRCPVTGSLERVPTKLP